jgi:hypothetical protein
MTIHTLGDSHSMFGWKDISGIVVHHIGPKLAFSVGRDGLVVGPEYGIQAGDTVIFSFGEIDCRCHVYKHVTPETPARAIVDSITTSYLSAIRDVGRAQPGVRICIYNVVPAVQRHTSAENREYPFLGTDEQRREFTLLFNEFLAAKCAGHGFTFIDVYARYTNAEGYINRAYSDGHVHIRDPVFIREYLVNHGFLKY